MGLNAGANMSLGLQLLANLTETALWSLDNTWPAYVLWLFTCLTGVFGNAIILIVFYGEKAFESNHYVLLEHLAAANSVACIKSLSEAVRRLIEWSTRSPFLLDKFSCVLVHPLIGDIAAKWLRLFIAADRILAVHWPLKYKELPRKFSWCLALFSWLWGIAEHSYWLAEASSNNKRLALCLPAIMVKDSTLSFTIHRDIFFSLSYVACYAALIVMFSLSIQKAARQGNHAVRQARRELQPKIIKAQLIDVTFVVLTFWTSTALREFYINGASREIKLITTPYIGLLIQLTNICNVFIYYVVNSNFKRAFQKTVLRRAPSSLGRTTSVGYTTFMRASTRERLFGNQEHNRTGSIRRKVTACSDKNNSIRRQATINSDPGNTARKKLAFISKIFMHSSTTTVDETADL